MRYDVSKATAPAMPNLGKGTECVKLLLSQVSKDIQEPLLPMTLPALAAHLCEVEFMYSDNKYYELCGQMGHLIGPSGIGKDQLHDLIEAIQRSFRARQFYKRDMINGFFGRIPFAYKARGERKGKIPRRGSYDEEFLLKLDEYLKKSDV